MVEERGSLLFYRPGKRHRVGARALPDAVDAKPGGANTAPEIIINIKL